MRAFSKSIFSEDICSASSGQTKVDYEPDGAGSVRCGMLKGPYVTLGDM